MDEFGRGSIQLELKYCERCGGLWLRPRGADIVFCACCARAMARLMSLPPAVHSREKCDETNRAQCGFWSEGGLHEQQLSD